MNDLNGGILPSGLFWTVDVRRSAVDFRMSGRRAALHVRNLALIDTFQFLGPNDTPATVDVRVVWDAIGPAVPRGQGTDVDPTDPAAFLGEIAPAVSRARIDAREIGFAFEVEDASSSPLAWAQIGTERNGVFL